MVIENLLQELNGWNLGRAFRDDYRRFRVGADSCLITRFAIVPEIFGIEQVLSAV